MRTHIDIDEDVLASVEELGGFATKREAVNAAFAEMARKLAARRLASRNTHCKWGAGLAHGPPSQPSPRGGRADHAGPKSRLVSRRQAARRPSELNETCAVAVPPAADSGRRAPAMACYWPSRLRNAAMFPAPPSFSTTTMPSRSVTLIECGPPASTLETNSRLRPPRAKVETVGLPAFTTKTKRPSPLSASAPCEPSPPPLAARAASASPPASSGAKTRSSLPAVAIGAAMLTSLVSQSLGHAG